MTISTTLQRLVDAKNNIANAIVSMGGSVGANDGLEAFPSAIDAIPSGGGGVEVDEDDLEMLEDIIANGYGSSISFGAIKIRDWCFWDN